MEKNEKKEKKRSNASGIVVMSIFVLALIVGAYFAYDYFVLQPKTYDIADDGAETTELYTADWFDASNVFNAMENNEGSFFYVKSDTDSFEGLPMYRTNKKGFNDACIITSEKSLGKAGSCMKTFFNLKGDDLPVDMEGRIDYKATMFGYVSLSTNEDGSGLMIYDQFGTNIKEYFEEHKLCLSCDKVTFSKVAVISTRGSFVFNNTNISDEGYNCTNNDFYMIGSADVTTESAEGDLSDLGLFAEPSETKTINFKVSISTDDAWGEYSLNYFQCW